MNFSRDGWRSLAALLVGGGLAVIAVSAIQRRFSRYEVAGTSMSPAYNPGDWLVVDRGAYGLRLPQPGDVIVLHDPGGFDRRMIKRVHAVTLHGDLDVRGDNASESTDSRTFGLVSPSLVVGRVRWRFHHGPMVATGDAWPQSSS